MIKDNFVIVYEVFVYDLLLASIEIYENLWLSFRIVSYKQLAMYNHSVPSNLQVLKLLFFTLPIYRYTCAYIRVPCLYIGAYIRVCVCVCVCEKFSMKSI